MSQEIDPCEYSQLSLTKQQKQYREANIVFSISGGKTTEHPPKSI